MPCSTAIRLRLCRRFPARARFPRPPLARPPLLRCLQVRPLVRAVAVFAHPGRDAHPRPLVHLLVVRLARVCRRHRRPTQPPLLTAPTALLTLADDDDPVPQRVPLLLAPVQPALAF